MFSSSDQYLNKAFEFSERCLKWYVRLPHYSVLSRFEKNTVDSLLSTSINSRYQIKKYLWFWQFLKNDGITGWAGICYVFILQNRLSPHRKNIRLFTELREDSEGKPQRMCGFPSIIHQLTKAIPFICRDLSAPNQHAIPTKPVYISMQLAMINSFRHGRSRQARILEIEFQLLIIRSEAVFLRALTGKGPRETVGGWWPRQPATTSRNWGCRASAENAERHAMCTTSKMISYPFHSIESGVLYGGFVLVLRLSLYWGVWEWRWISNYSS